MAKKEKKPFSLKKEVMEWMETLVWATVAVVLVFTFLGRTAVVSGSSMLPTYHDGDRMLISSLGYTPEYGDVVVFAEKSGDKENLIKRVIATEGQTVDINFETGEVSVDGVVLEEPYIYEQTEEEGNIEFPATVPEGHIFVLGDNRNNSRDSRFGSIGMVDERLILGRAYWQIFPLSKLGFIG
ncbi:MAG: signal peptidase I [Oscillospiraceae bacterium]|nr:signal peptidase I [Oscillospiraceae bacterium]